MTAGPIIVTSRRHPAPLLQHVLRLLDDTDTQPIFEVLIDQATMRALRDANREHHEMLVTCVAEAICTAALGSDRLRGGLQMEGVTCSQRQLREWGHVTLDTNLEWLVHRQRVMHQDKCTWPLTQALFAIDPPTSPLPRPVGLTCTSPPSS